VRAALVYAGPGSPVADNLRALGVGEVLRQDPFPSERVPIVDYHLAFVGGSGDPLPRIAVADTLPPSPRDRGMAALAPGSGGPSKNWPRERFAELASLLERRALSVSWITGPAEEETAAPPGARGWRNLPLPVLAAGLSRCRLYVGNDSGVTHLAAASGCPTIALFGATDPLVWSPRGKAVRVIAGRTMDEISLAEVWSACREALS
jgi:ADP-heptose:LPS heptosyltransferase